MISQKLTQDKRVVTDFRHLNIRIAKNNLAYPLVRDTFSVLGNSKYEALSVLDLKDAFHLLRLSEDSKRYCSILQYVGSASYIYQRIPMKLNISLSIWQSYINATQTAYKIETIVKQSWTIYYFSHPQRKHI